MRKLVFDPQPRRNYPFKDFVMNPAMRGNIRFPLSGKSMHEFVRGAFLERRGNDGDMYFVERQQLRAHLRDMLVGRGYEVNEQNLSDDSLSLGAGGVDLTNTGIDAAEGNPYRQGIVTNTEFGNIEAAHVHLLVDSVRRAVSERTGWVLDVGCGPVVDQKRNLESLGIERIIYADYSPQYIDKIHSGLAEQGRSDVQRRFLKIDKAELPKEIDPDTVSLIIRAGVGMLDRKEAAGLRTVGTENVEMCVFNGIDGNPLEPFLEVAEDHFNNVEVHLGYERYALRLVA